MSKNNFTINNLTSNKEKFIYYKFLLDKTYNKINKIIQLKEYKQIEEKQHLKYLTSKLEKLLIITNNYKLILELKQKSYNNQLNQLNHLNQFNQFN